MQQKAAVTIRASADDLYRRWRDIASLPTFMTHLESVTVTGERTSHWIAKAPLGQVVQWDAEIVEDTPSLAIAWRSVEGADVSNAGRVTFLPAPGDQGTEVHVEITYDVPGGPLATLLAKLTGEEPHQQIKDDLHRFKQIVETGEVLRSDGSPEGEDAGGQLRQREAAPVGATEGGAR